MERPGSIVRSNSASTVGESSARFASIDHLVHDPLSSGFLLKYCKEQFSDENMLFVVAVDRFRDYFHRDHRSWPTTPWRILDQEWMDSSSPESESLDEFMTSFTGDPNFFPDNTWPSTVVIREAVKEVIIQIIREFLAKDAEKWICISQSVLNRTIKRIRLLHIYGRDVFAEAMIDPMRTIEKDIYPRFVQNLHYRKMLETVQTLDKKAYMEKFKLPKPERVVLDRYSRTQLQQNKVSFTINDLIEDGILYSEFSSYLESCVAEENLKCLRAVAIYKDSFNVREVVKSPYDYAVLVYRYFIAPRAPFEVCISHVHSNEILRGLADPYPALFDAVERSALGALNTHFNTYRTTPQYANLCKVVLAASKLPSLSNNVTSPGGMSSGASSKYVKKSNKDANNNNINNNPGGTRLGSSASAPAIIAAGGGGGGGGMFASCFPNTR